MFALTFYQPDAERVLAGELRVDSRRFWAPVQGPLLVHAGRCRDWCARYEPARIDELPFGSLVGLVTVAAAYHVHQVERAVGACPELLWLLRQTPTGPYAYALTRPWRFELPLAYRGSPGFFHVNAGDVAGQPLLDERGQRRYLADYRLAPDRTQKELFP